MVWLCTFLPFCPKIDSLAIRRQIKALLTHLVPFWFLVIGFDCSYDKVSPNFISLLVVWRVVG